MNVTKKKILVIDDEQTICFLLENFLSKEHEVVCKTSAAEGLKWLDDHFPDLIISDIQMKEMDGFEFLKEVRSRGFMKHIPIVMLSGRTASKERVKCYKLGAQDYLTKPFNPEELVEVVNKNLFPIHFTNVW